MSEILEKKGSFFDRKYVKIRKRGPHLPHSVNIFGQLGENNLKCYSDFNKKGFDMILNFGKKTLPYMKKKTTDLHGKCQCFEEKSLFLLTQKSAFS